MLIIKTCMLSIVEVHPPLFLLFLLINNSFLIFQLGKIYPLFFETDPMTKLVFTTLVFILSSLSYAKQIDLFIMAGQSNMQGWRSDAASYPVDPHQMDKRIPFYFEAINYSSSHKSWQTMTSQAGHFKSGHFGPEVSFSRALLKSKLNPAIFKYSSGGSSIKTDWKGPGKKGLYDDMVANIHKAISELKAQGHTVVPQALIWIQGESDAYNDQLANEYYWHLRKMIQHLRTNVLRKPSLPVILSLDEQHPQVQERPQVVEAQLKLAMEDDNISFVTMYGLEKYDVTHLTARGTIQQGNRLFSSFKQLQ